MSAHCFFCFRPETKILAENELALAFLDKFPSNYWAYANCPQTACSKSVRNNN